MREFIFLVFIKNTNTNVSPSFSFPLLFFFIVRVLQYRSVAFVTYVSEFHAQFAKEAMACQSLDNDEILNVRWATEDPNPVMKVVEKRRLEDMGQEAIRAKMDPRIVDAMRSVRALEEGQPLELEDAYPDDEEQNGGQDDDDANEDGQRDPKRRRIENGDASPSPPAQGQQSQIPPNPLGLLSADTLEGLKYFAHLRQRNEGAAAVKQQQRAPPPKTTGLGLADYGSDDDDD